MSTDTDSLKDDEGTTKIDVRVPSALLEAIDGEYGRRGYTSRSEAIRDALRDWLTPAVDLSDEVREALAESREQRERGETIALDDVMDKYGVEAGASDEQ